MPFTIVRNDITKMETDAIVNAANTGLQMGSGVCGAIFKAAGAQRLQQACNQLAPIQTGQAVMTPGFDLAASYIIHTAGPVYRGGGHGEATLLRSCYLNALQLAENSGCASIAFPLISSGVYGYPKKEALQIAARAIGDFLQKSDMDVFLVVFDKASFLVGEGLLGAVGSYIDEHYMDQRASRQRSMRQVDAKMAEPAMAETEMLADLFAPLEKEQVQGLNELCGRLDEPFSQTLMRLIDAKGRQDVEVYKRANIDRRLFSKIRSNKGYMPGKRTAVAFAVALELSLEETGDLLRRAGYALSHSVLFDVIIEYFICNRRYDVFEINEVLFHYDQPLLGG